MLKISNIKLEKLLLLSIKIGVFLVLLVPVIMYKNVTFPALLPRSIYFRILVEIIFLLYTLLVLLNRKYLPRFSFLLISLFIFLEVLVFSTIKSINPMRSFWGTIERMEGLVTFLHLFAFFLILVGIFREKKEWLNLLRFTILVSIPVGVAAILQKTGVYYFFSNPQDPRVTGTLGNSVLYGSYLVLIIFLSIFLIFWEEKKAWKIVWTVLFAFNLIMLFLTGTRGAWFGAGGGIIFLIFVWLFFFSRKKERTTILFAIFIFLFFFLLFLLLHNLGYLGENFFLRRYETAWFDLVRARSSRFAVWQLGLDAWKDSPFFGYGLESFSYIFDKYYQASLTREFSETLFFDRAHNKIIDILVASGILGLIAYLGLLAATIIVLLKNCTHLSLDDSDKLSKKKFLAFVLVAFFLGYFLQNLLAFDTINTYFILFLVFAFIDVNFRKEKEEVVLEQAAPEEEKIALKSKDSTNKIAFLFKALIMGFVFFVVFYGISIHIRFFLANKKLSQAHNFMGQGDYQEALVNLEKSLLQMPWFARFETYYYAAETVFYAIPYYGEEERKDFSKELQKTAKYLEDYLDSKADIFQMRSYLIMARIYKTVSLIEEDKKFLDEGERILAKTIKLNSEHPGVYRLGGYIKFHQGKIEEGMVLFAKAYEIDNDIGKFYEWVGDALMEINEKEKGVEYLRKGLKFGNFYTKENFNPRIIWALADVYEELKDYQEMAELYEEAIRLWPEGKPDAQLYASLSTVYAKMGNKKKAREITYEMLELYPGLKSQAEQFLNDLDKL